MTLMTCTAVQRRLQAFHDRELAIGETIAVETHLSGCPPCMTDLRAMQSVGDALRLAARPGPADDWTGLTPGVISRMRAEAHESWAARARRFVEHHGELPLQLRRHAHACRVRQRHRRDPVLHLRDLRLHLQALDDAR